ncbi:VOC family protein [Sphingomonas sp.]|uniref:VOC family protein n=1 Tax=Sphingomonas sp. TaxID=28214 RepID=UPI003B000422
MSRTIFVSLPVANVARSAAFYEAIGFVKDPRFSTEQAAALRWADGIAVMVLDRAFYSTLTPKPIADARATSGALFALGLESRAAVDEITERAIAAGGREAHGPEDLGFMYSRAFEDLDGHGFGPMWMDTAAGAA